jgi:hypothetical protein
MITLISKPRLAPYRRITRQIALSGETELLLRKLAARTGESVRTALIRAVQEKHHALDREKRRRIEWSRKHRAAKPCPWAT